MIPEANFIGVDSYNMYLTLIHKNEVKISSKDKVYGEIISLEQG